jgi:hypothetical protein
LFDRELVCAATVIYCKGWPNGSVPEGSNEEEEHSSDRVIRPFRTSLMAIVTLAHRQLGLEKLVVFLHGFPQIKEMPML